MSSADQVWRALADPTRRAILDLLAAGARSTGDVCAHFAEPQRGGIGRTGIMKHLDVLQQAELVVARREGRTRWNHLNPVPVQAVCDRWVSRHVKGLARSLQRLKTLAEEPPGARRGGLFDLDIPPGSRLVLEVVDPARDAQELFDCSHGSRQKRAIWTYMAYGPFEDEAAMAAWLAQCAAATATRFLTVRERAGGRAVGMAAMQAYDPDHRRVELGHIWYGTAAQRTGINTEVVYLLLCAAFRHGCRRVEWKCDARNRRSREAALRLGFASEGIFRQHMLIKGKNRDTAWFAMLDRQWPAVQKALERWLAMPAPERPSLASMVPASARQ